MILQFIHQIYILDTNIQIDNDSQKTLIHYAFAIYSQEIFFEYIIISNPIIIFFFIKYFDSFLPTA